MPELGGLREKREDGKQRCQTKESVERWDVPFDLVHRKKTCCSRTTPMMGTQKHSSEKEGGFLIPFSHYYAQ